MCGKMCAVRTTNLILEGKKVEFCTERSKSSIQYGTSLSGAVGVRMETELRGSARGSACPITARELVFQGERRLLSLDRPTIRAESTHRALSTVPS